MSKRVVDAWAWLEYLKGSAPGKKAAAAIEGGGEVYTCPVSIAEVASRLKRAEKDYQTATARVISLSRVTPCGAADAALAGALHAEVKARSPNFSLADAFVLSAARSLGAKVLTGDPDFKGIKEAELVE
ncbi:MAG: PIN domain-containing protein [Nitrososphaerota archaeon]|nr:PIN domain-containing protein [Nitrososphaerota archaeon]MDG7023201.1 PIN domain-containing protein [Nitrososphaerota archaeon]